MGVIEVVSIHPLGIMNVSRWDISVQTKVAAGMAENNYTFNVA